MTCAETSLSLGAYVLGSLDPAERRTVEEHLAECSECAAEVAELEPLPALLGRLDIDDVEPPQLQPSHDLFDRVAAAAEVRDSGRVSSVPRPSRGRWLVAAAAVVVLALAGVGLGLRLTASNAHTYAASAGQIHMSVTTSAQQSGTQLAVAVSGLPREEHCWLVAVARDGSRHPAGQWVATYSGNAQVTGSTDVPRDQLSRVVLLGTGGQQLVTVQL